MQQGNGVIKTRDIVLAMRWLFTTYVTEWNGQRTTCDDFLQAVM